MRPISYCTGYTLRLSVNATAACVTLDARNAMAAPVMPNLGMRTRPLPNPTASAANVPALDFNGSSRTGTNDVGAYRYNAAGNPGWVISAGFKTSGTVVRPNPPTNLTAQ